MDVIKILKTPTRDLTQGNLKKQLIALTFPMIFGSLGTMIFNIVDTFYIGQLGTKQLAAISFTFPIVMVVMSLSIGLSTGATSLISRAIGERNPEKVKGITTQSLLLSLIVVTLFIIVGMLTIEPTFKLLGAKGELLKMAGDYMRIWYPGMIFVVVPMTSNGAIRSTGDTKFPSMIMLTATIVNIILDPILIFGLFGFPRLELEGAAIATVIARSVTLIFALWLLYKKLDMITFSLPSFKIVIANWKKLLYIGLPAGATNIVIPISIGVVTSILAHISPEAVAAFGVATRLEGFLLVILMALGMSVGPVIGQNWGAKKYERILLTAKYSFKFALFWGGFIWLLMLGLSKPIAALFNNNSMVINYVSLYFLIIAWGYGFRGILRISTTVLSIINKPLDSALMNILQAVILLIPLSFLGNYLFGIKGVFAALVISYSIAGNFAYWWMRKTVNKRINAGSSYFSNSK